MLRIKKGTTRKQLENALLNIVGIFYLEIDGDKVTYNPDKEWDSAADYCEMIHDQVEGLAEWKEKK